MKLAVETAPPKTFKEFDKLELKHFALRLESFMAVEHCLVEGGLVVSLNAPFGSGKTAFIEMWQQDLLERRQGKDDLPIPILLNAWESDYCGDPLLAIISSLSDALKASASSKEQREQINKLEEAANDTAFFALALANEIAAKVGFDAIKAGKLTQEKKLERKVKREGVDLLEVYRNRSEALKRLKNGLKVSFGGEDITAIVFVDELDRCRPTYAVEYLETIKHVFDVRGLAFVLAVDKSQLESSSKALFGAGLNFKEYYRKFVHRNVSLPKISHSGRQNLTSEYISRFIHFQERFSRNRWSLQPIDDHFYRALGEIIEALEMTPRQTQEAFRIFGHLLASETNPQNHILWCYGAGALFLSFLAVCNPEQYQLFGTKKLTFLEANEAVSSIMRRSKERKKDWWVKLIGTGAYDMETSDWRERMKSELVDLNMAEDKDTNAVHSILGQFLVGWGSSNGDGMAQIYASIESAKRLDER